MVQRLGLGWLAVALCMTACASYTSGVHADAPLHPGSAYLYGRFFMNALQDSEAIGNGRQSMGLVLRCDSGSSYTFGSMDQRKVQVLEIKPSRCWLVKTVLADQNGIVRKELNTPPALQRPLDFTAGRAHYIGDYFAKGHFAVEGGGIESWDWAWSAAAGDRYAETTAEMKRTFPNIASLPTEDRRLLPEPPRKRGNGIGPSPGEPTLSPPIVARLAPLIKRSYPTPAQCEAACPAGQCLPYRGPSGPQMACIVHCDRNADCPAGLACSCPNSEVPAVPDCHPIAQRPKDPLPRLCLTPEALGQP